MTQVILDNRGLEPPQPLVRILQALASLGAGDELVALMDREPRLLYPELERRGYAWEFSDAGDGPRIRIWRAASA
ncbi:MAG: hypothetical protein KatS3mg062_1417 [Tepidiforma sp.]|nr:MAG: hypothetical protein KatS3mg062_1417 [Tepidiforma sp.]